MTTTPLRLGEKDQPVINQAIAQLQQGRSNAHGSFSLETGVTTTTVKAITCSAGCDVNLSPQTAHAGNIIRTADFWVVPGAGSFVVHHDNTANADCTFSYSING